MQTQGKVSLVTKDVSVISTRGQIPLVEGQRIRSLRSSPAGGKTELEPQTLLVRSPESNRMPVSPGERAEPGPVGESEFFTQDAGLLQEEGAPQSVSHWEISALREDVKAYQEQMHEYKQVALGLLSKLEEVRQVLTEETERVRFEHAQASELVLLYREELDKLREQLVNSAGRTVLRRIFG